LEKDLKSETTYHNIKTFDQKNWVSENLNYKKDSESKSWVLQRITGLTLVVLMTGHYFSMHYQPESGHT